MIKRTMTALLSLAFVAGASTASAQDITSIGAAFSNPLSPTIAIVDNTDPNAIQACWRIPSTGNCDALGDNQRLSGYQFERAGVPIAFTTSPFSLGQFTHFNFPITLPGLTSVDLALTYGIGGATPASFSDSWTIFHEETPNNAGTCSYPSTTPCADKVSFALSGTATQNFFSYGGNQYQISLLGFGATAGAGDLSPDFITQEGQENATQLWAVIEPHETSTVPEPATMTLLATGLIAMAGARRRRKNKS